LTARFSRTSINGEGGPVSNGGSGAVSNVLESALNTYAF
jgi:hypothetical protein